MNSNHPSSAPDNKWQSMLDIVNQSALAPFSDKPFKQLIRRRLLTENIFAFLLQYAGLALTTVTTQPFPIWFAPGVACGFIFMRGYTILPGMWLGGLLAYYLAHADILVTVTCTSLFTVQTALLLWLGYRYISPTLIFYSRSLFIKFFVGSATLAAITSVLLVAICFHHIQTIMTPMQLWLTWWLGNLNSILVFALAIATWDYYFAELHALSRINKPLLVITYGCLIGLTMALIFAHTLFAAVTLACLAFIATFVISRLFKWCGTVSALFIMGLLMTFCAFLMPPEQLCIEQVLIVFCAFFGILVDI